MMRNSLLSALLSGLLWVTPAAAQNLNYKPDPNWKPPAAAVAKKNPVAGKPDAKASGRKLFQRNCTPCHGIDGSGIAPAADLQLPVVQSQSDGALFWKITNGHLTRGMPPFGPTLSETERWQVVTYLRLLAKGARAISAGSSPRAAVSSPVAR